MWTFLVSLFFLYWKWLAIYIAGGVAYSVFKWFLMLVKLRRKLDEITKEGKTDNEFNMARKDLVRSMFGQYEYPPTASKNKANFLMWSTLWPLNALWTAVADVAKEAWLWIYKKIGAMLDAMARAILPA